MNIFIAGCGDIGSRLAHLHLAAGDNVCALVRATAKAAEWQRDGIQYVTADLDSDLPEPGWPRPDRIYMLVPPAGDGDTDPRLQIILNWLDQGDTPQAFIYFSTTGVYGDCGGDRVDESRPINPDSLRARRRVAAETLLRDWSRDKPVRVGILRVAGIYGPGRLPLERLHRGDPVLKAEEAPWSNRIHADDLARAALRVACDDRDTGIFNASDGNPTTMTDYFNRIADLYGLPRPPQISMAEARERLTPAMLSFLQESRRIDNRRLLGLPGFELRYPDLASGLAACRAAENLHASSPNQSRSD